MAQGSTGVTIAAISTALGEGGIAIIRVSGSLAFDVAGKFLTRKNFDVSGKLYLTNLIDEHGSVIDRVLAVHFNAPKTYTGENICEIHTHGGILAARTCLELLLANGARLAEPGEFTRRAFLNGRIDLSQAEGVLSLIKSRSLEALHAAARTLTGELSGEIRRIHSKILELQSNIEVNLDFPEGEVFDGSILPELEQVITQLDDLLSRCQSGMALQNGVHVVIAGSPNVGKSSLLNALLHRNRAIVTDIPGTTRDIIQDSIVINGLPVTLSDTAGLRESEDVIEAQGVKLAHEAVKNSDICLYVVDSSRELTSDERNFIDSLDLAKSIIVFNKADLETKADITCEKIHVSAKTLSGIEELKSLIYERASRNAILSDGLNVSSGQLEDIRESLNSLKEAKYSLMNHEGEDITAGLINSARVNLLRVIGLDAGDELLDSMFSRFCVGK